MSIVCITACNPAVGEALLRTRSLGCVELQERANEFASLERNRLPLRIFEAEICGLDELVELQPVCVALGLEQCTTNSTDANMRSGEMANEWEKTMIQITHLLQMSCTISKEGDNPT